MRCTCNHQHMQVNAERTISSRREKSLFLPMQRDGIDRTRIRAHASNQLQTSDICPGAACALIKVSPSIPKRAIQ